MMASLVLKNNFEENEEVSGEEESDTGRAGAEMAHSDRGGFLLESRRMLRGKMTWKKRFFFIYSLLHRGEWQDCLKQCTAIVLTAY